MAAPRRSPTPRNANVPAEASRRTGPFRRVPSAAVAALAIVVLALLMAPGVGSAASRSLGGQATGAPRPSGAAGTVPSFVVNRVYYTSTFDGLNLSYSEILPTNYSANRTYPLAVELHGLTLGQSTPMIGGYVTPVVNTTAAAAAANGIILIILNTRTGDGWFVNSPYTGPQQQDVLDAITHERAVRSIGSVYVFGESMGAIGALSVALHDRTAFAGVGAIAGASDQFMLLDWAQSVLHDSSLVSAILAPTNGSWPNATSAARSIFDWLSVLRFDPDNASGLRVYVASGAADTVATNNPELWPYEQANSTLLDVTCWSALAVGEPGNCTRPLAALAALDPTGFAFRYLFEPNGPHEYTLLNATDMFRFFLGQVPTGTYWGSWPAPTPVAPPVPLVTVATQPWNCGTVGIDGIPRPSGTTVRTSASVHPVTFTSCPGYGLTAVRTTGAVAYNASTAQLTVNGSGAVVAYFDVPHFQVNVSTSLGCPTIDWNGTVVPNGTSLVVPAGWFIAGAASCGFATFSEWNTTGGVSVEHTSNLETEVSVRGNGSLRAVYSVPTSSDAPKAAITLVVTPPSCGPVVVNGTAYPNGTVVDLNLGSYSVVASSCAGYSFAGWIASAPGARVANAPAAVTTLYVTGDGSVTALYTPPSPGNPVYSVTVGITPAGCGAVVQLGTPWFTNGSTVLLAPGNYTIAAGSCTGYVFRSWSTSGGVWLAPPGNGLRTLIVSGNGFLNSTFDEVAPVVVPPTPVATSAPAEAPPPSWAWIGIGVALGAAAMGGVVIWIYARRSRL